MADSTIQQIKERLDIVDVVSGYLKLEKTGINLRANCPFHGEKTPSFFVSPSRQMFKCFGCNSGGDVFQFVMQMEGIEFGDALRMLARRAGVELPTYHPETQTKRNRIYDILDLSCRFFEKQLHSSQIGQEVLKYLANRGLKPETITKWRLGYSPDQWRALSDFLVGQSYQRAEILEAGLAVASEKGGDSYDRFRGRIIFPVFDLNSQVVGFGGRVFGEKPKNESQPEKVNAKYINTPSTPLYDKSRVLYGLNFAKTDIRRNDQCILTEGYTDVILSHQAGFTNTVSSSGTALTNQHLKIIKRYTNNLLMAFDADTGGDLATQRGIDLALNEGFNVKVIVMPHGLDPADVISQDAQKWAKFVEEAQEIMAFYFDTALNRFGLASALGKKQIGQFLLPRIKRIPNAIVKSHWVQKLADVLQVSEGAIIEEMSHIKLDNNNALSDSSSAQAVSVSYNNVSQNGPPKSRIALLEQRITSLLFSCPEGLDLVDEEHLEMFSVAGAKDTIKALKTNPVESSEQAQAVCQRLSQERKEIKEFLDSVLFWSEVQPAEDGLGEIQLCLDELKNLASRRTLQNIAQEIRQAEAISDSERLQNLIQQFNELSKGIV